MRKIISNIVTLVTFVILLILTVFTSNDCIAGVPPNTAVGREFLIMVVTESCPACTNLKLRMQQPLARQALKFYTGLFYIDANKYPKYAAYYKAASYPTLLRLRRISDQQYVVIDRVVGDMSQLRLIAWLSKRFVQTPTQRPIVPRRPISPLRQLIPIRPPTPQYNTGSS